MNALRRLFLTVPMVSLIFIFPAHAQSCPDGKIGWADDFHRAVLQVAGLTTNEAPQTPEQTNAAVQQGVQRAQETVNPQITAPSTSQSGSSIVDRAFFPSLLGMAIENGLVKNESNITTVDLNLFAFLSMARPEVLFDQSKYEEYSWLRRFGGTISSGGKGLKFDRDGDGKADDPLEAKELGDIVNWEARIRLSPHSRDPRESYNVEEITSAVKATQLAFSDAESTFIARNVGNINPDANGCVDAARWKTLLADASTISAIQGIASTLKSTLTARDNAVNTIANRLVWTLAIGGVQQKPQFGPDSVKVALRADWRGSTLNIEGMKSNPLVGNADAKTAKLGYMYTTKWLKGSLIPEGVDLSASVDLERFWDVPGAKHSTIQKVNVAFEYPLTKGIKIPVSVTWANHADLLTNERDIRGHIGFTIDLSKLTKAQVKQ